MASSPMLVLACSCTAWLLQVIRPGRETDRHTRGQGPGSQRVARDRMRTEERERERHSEHTSAEHHSSLQPAFLYGADGVPDYPCSSWLFQGGVWGS